MRPISELPDIIKDTWGTPYGVCFTYGDLIYADIDILPKDVMVHERVHMKQQQKPHEWWQQYNTDLKFRYEQEIEAYRAQYKYLKATQPRKAFAQAKEFSRLLSSDMYGFLSTYQQALLDITK